MYESVCSLCIPVTLYVVNYPKRRLPHAQTGDSAMMRDYRKVGYGMYLLNQSINQSN